MSLPADPRASLLPPSGEGVAGVSGAQVADGEGDARIATITSAQLFAGATEVQIDHHGAVYRLKQTSLGKLILTK